ncbi:hypothetical protein [Hymenobacter glacieicola]|uniref:STAS domain-containing protein n=1 Tax=Hymenobacter glacieicola TaxID=1562124 RepID=A0ABQ1X140_9BACT|nr:hypothetical protein [Hymenobacter glacieicola]GGG54722.1 hypothetical protein GCM10011378_33650 [Hymenobacter glacieicola]
MNPDQFFIFKVGSKGCVGLHLRGQISSVTDAIRLEQAVVLALPATGAKHIWVDCQQLGPLTRQAQQAIWRADRLAQQAGITLHWCDLPLAVVAQLQETGMHLVLHLVASSPCLYPSILREEVA